MKKKLLSILFLLTPMLILAQEKGIAEKINEGFKPSKLDTDTIE